MQTLLVGLERLSPVSVPANSEEKDYWQKVEEIVSLLAELRRGKYGDIPLFRFVETVADVGTWDVFRDCSYKTWRERLDGVLVFLRPSCCYPFADRFMECDALSVRRRGIPDSAGDYEKFGPPVAALAPEARRAESYSHAIVAVRPERYRFLYWDGGFHSVLAALRWLEEFVPASQP
jgi:hypothetical protein